MSYLVTERNARVMLTDALSFEFLVIYIQESLATDAHSYCGFNTAELIRGAANICRCSREASHMVRLLLRARNSHLVTQLASTRVLTSSLFVDRSYSPQIT